MKTFVLSIFFLIFCNSLSFGQDSLVASKTNKEVTYFKRVTLVVADIDRSLHVYRDILGFSVNSRKASTADSFSYPVFRIPEKAQISFATLDGPEQNRTIGLTEVKGVDLQKDNGIHMTASVIKVVDLKSCIAKIQKLGLEVTKSKRVNKTNFSFIEQAFVDFDGHLIVLYELIQN